MSSRADQLLIDGRVALKMAFMAKSSEEGIAYCEAVDRCLTDLHRIAAGYAAMEPMTGMTPDDLKRQARAVPDAMPHLAHDIMLAALAWEDSLLLAAQRINSVEQKRHDDTARLDFLESQAESGLCLRAEFIGTGETKRGPVWNCETRDRMDEPVPGLAGDVRGAIDEARIAQGWTRTAGVVCE